MQMETIKMHSDLMQLREKSEAERKQYFLQLYQRAIKERVDSVLSYNGSAPINMKEIIESLVKPHVLAESGVTSGNSNVKWNITSDEFTSFSAQLLQQCALCTKNSFYSKVSLVCNALSEKRAYEFYCGGWEVIVAPVRAERLQDAMPLLAALFERAEFVRQLSAHGFVVPLFIGCTTQFDVDTQYFQEFCLSLNNNKLKIGAIAQTLLRVYAEKSSEIATKAIGQLLTHHYAINPIEWLISWAESNVECNIDENLTKCFKEISRFIHKETDWKEQQIKYFTSALAVEEIWTFPCDFVWTLNQHTRTLLINVCLIFSNLNNVINGAAALFKQHSARHERKTLIEALDGALYVLFEFLMQMMQRLNDRSTQEVLTYHLHVRNVQTLPLKLHSIETNFCGANSACTHTMNMWTRLIESKLLFQNIDFLQNYKNKMHELHVNIQFFLTNIAFVQAYGKGEGFEGGFKTWKPCYDFKFSQSFCSLVTLLKFNLEFIPLLVRHSENEHDSQKIINLYSKTISIIFALLYPICVIEKTFEKSKIQYIGRKVATYYTEYKMLNKMLILESGELQNNFYFISNTNLAVLNGILKRLLIIYNKHLHYLKMSGMYFESINLIMNFQVVKSSNYFYDIWLVLLHFFVQNIGLHNISAVFEVISSSRDDIISHIIHPEQYRLIINELNKPNKVYINLIEFWDKISKRSITIEHGFSSEAYYINKLQPQFSVSELKLETFEKPDSRVINEAFNEFTNYLKGFKFKLFGISGDQKKMQQLIKILSHELECEILLDSNIDIDASDFRIEHDIQSDISIPSEILHSSQILIAFLLVSESSLLACEWQRKIILHCITANGVLLYGNKISLCVPIIDVSENTVPHSIRDKLALFENNKLKLGSDIIRCVNEHIHKKFDLFKTLIPYWKSHMRFGSEIETLEILEAYTFIVKCWKVNHSHQQIQWIAPLTELISLMGHTISATMVDMIKLVEALATKDKNNIKSNFNKKSPIDGSVAFESIFQKSRALNKNNPDISQLLAVFKTLSFQYVKQFLSEIYHIHISTRSVKNSVTIRSLEITKQIQAVQTILSNSPELTSSFINCCLESLENFKTYDIKTISDSIIILKYLIDSLLQLTPLKLNISNSHNSSLETKLVFPRVWELGIFPFAENVHRASMQLRSINMITQFCDWHLNNNKSLTKNNDLIHLLRILMCDAITILWLLICALPEGIPNFHTATKLTRENKARMLYQTICDWEHFEECFVQMQVVQTFPNFGLLILEVCNEIEEIESTWNSQSYKRFLRADKSFEENPQYSLLPFSLVPFYTNLNLSLNEVMKNVEDHFPDLYMPPAQSKSKREGGATSNFLKEQVNFEVEPGFEVEQLRSRGIRYSYL